MWAKGTRVRGKLIEKSGDTHWIVSIGGNLLGVENKTTLEFRVNQWVELEVVRQNPITFQMIGRIKKNTRQIQIRI